MWTHVSRTVSVCFAMLRQIRNIRRSVTLPVLQSLVAALTLSCRDYGCSTMVGLPARQFNRLLWVLNAAAHLVYSAQSAEHVSPCLRELHWLRVPRRIEFNHAVFAYRCLNGTALQCLADGLQRVADISLRSRLHSALTTLLHIPRSNHKTISDRTFPVTSAKVWNSLPPWITSLPSLFQFRKTLKSELFRRSYGDDRHWSLIFNF